MPIFDKMKVRGLIHPRKAVRILYRLLLRSPEVDVFPSHAPEAWKVEAWGGANPDLYVRKQKAGMRAQKSLQIGLAAGQLKAVYVDESDRQSIPTWAWENNDRTAFVWNEGRLPLDILLPDRWQRWTRHRCFIERDSLRTWLKADFIKLGSDLPDVVRSERRPPAPISHRAPPSQPYVPLCEAVSWIAYGVAMPSDSLFELIQTGEIGQGYQWAIKRLEAAVTDFADAALGQHIRCIGRYKPTYSEKCDDLTDFIAPVRFADFRRLDIVGNGFFYGSGLAQCMNEGALHLIMGEGRSDSLFDVKVDRADLMAHFAGRHVRPQANPSNAPKRVARSALQDWLTSLRDGGARQTQRELYKMANAHFEAAVPREWIRDLTSGRKRGPKPKGH